MNPDYRYRRVSGMYAFCLKLYMLRCGKRTKICQSYGRRSLWVYVFRHAVTKQKLSHSDQLKLSVTAHGRLVYYNDQEELTICLKTHESHMLK